jgi:hypothetical protein
MELSDLVRYAGRLYACDDRTGIGNISRRLRLTFSLRTNRRRKQSSSFSSLHSNGRRRR